MNEQKKDTLKRAIEENKQLRPDGVLEEKNSPLERMNKNSAVFGATGSGKTNGWAYPELAVTTDESIIFTDMKGEAYEKFSPMFKERGYTVYLVDFVDPAASPTCINSIANLKTSNDVMAFSRSIAYLNRCREDLNDTFWPDAKMMLYNVCLGYMMERGRGISPNFADFLQMLTKCDLDAIEKKETSAFSILFEQHKKEYEKRTGKKSWAYDQFKKLMGRCSSTISTLLVSAYADLVSLDTQEMRRMLSKNDLELTSIAREKTAVFINVSDTDRSKDAAINILYTQLMDQLCRFADSQQEKRLPIPVRFILDDFGTSAKIEGFESIISNIRSRDISVTLMLQSIAQLEKSYGMLASRTILANCAAKLYMGGSDIETAQYFSQLTNKPFDKILNMPLRTHWLVRQGEKPIFGRTVLLHEYDLDGLHLS